MTCPFCGHEMEQWSEPTLDSVTWEFWLCPHCGTEIGENGGRK